MSNRHRTTKKLQEFITFKVYPRTNKRLRTKWTAYCNKPGTDPHTSFCAWFDLFSQCEIPD